MNACFISSSMLTGILCWCVGSSISDRSDVEVLHVERVRLDEFAARLDFVPHERREDLVRGVGIGELYLEQGAGLRVHGGFPELLRVHLAETLVPLNVEALARAAFDVV